MDIRVHALECGNPRVLPFGRDSRVEAPHHELHRFGGVRRVSTLRHGSQQQQNEQNQPDRHWQFTNTSLRPILGATGVTPS